MWCECTNFTEHNVHHWKSGCCCDLQLHGYYLVWGKWSWCQSVLYNLHISPLHCFAWYAMISHLHVWCLRYFLKLPGYLPCYPPQVLHVFGPKHATTIYGWTFSTGVSLVMLWAKKLQIPILQIVSSVILTLYTQLAFENIGYAWTFIIMGFIASAGTSESCTKPTYI